MKTSKRGLELIKAYEGLRLNSYADAVGVWTIGYGHTSDAFLKVKRGQKITAAKAEELLIHDIEEAETALDKMCTVELNSNQYGAVISLMFNIGNGSFKKSTLLKKLNRGDYTGASKEFAKWSKAGGKTLKGLVRRRAAEAALFNTPSELEDKPLKYPDVQGASKETVEAREAKGTVAADKPGFFAGIKNTVLSVVGVGFAGYTSADYFNWWKQVKEIAGDNLPTIALVLGGLVIGGVVIRNLRKVD